MPLAKFQGCKAWAPKLYGDQPYGYAPGLAPGIAFSVTFGLSTLIHVVQACVKKRYWCMLFAVGALTELIGWAGRTWSSQCPYNLDAFLMQITTLIIAPTFFTAAIYVILGRLIVLFGRHTSPISANLYLWIFGACDIISLVIQAIGGGLASTAIAKVPPRSTDLGTHIMIAGIVFQMASVSVFVGFFILFLVRVNRGNQPLSTRVWIMVYGSAFSVGMIYIRGVYRMVELAQGWTGYLITHEPYFVALDAALMLAAVAVFNIIHPGWFLPTAADTRKSDEETITRSDTELVEMQR